MPEAVSGPGGPRPGPAAITPRTAGGWVALGFAAFAVVSWVAGPLITIAYRPVCPITDSWVMPVAGCALTAVAAALNGLCVWRWRERSLLNLAALALLLPVALFTAIMLIGYAVGGG